MVVNGSNNLDYKLIAVQLLRHVLDDTNNKAVVLLFDDTLGPLHNLLRHLGCKVEDHLKSGKLTTVA